jgi:tetratricopeptide (TPR) repeat protein
MKFIIVLIISIQALAAIKDPIYDNYEGLDLVEALIRDGNLKAAEEELNEAPTSNRKWLVMGHLAFAAKKYPQAINNYLKATEDQSRNLSLARAYGRSQEWKDCRRFYLKAAQTWLSREEDIALKSTCEFRTEKWQETLTTLNSGYQKAPSFVLQREFVGLLLEMGLTRAALDTVFNLRTPSASESLSLAELFHNKKLIDDTLTVLEWTRTRFPFDLDTNLTLAKVYFGKGQLRTTAEAFERAARIDPRYAYHAAEIRRQLGDMQIAQYWITYVPDEKERLKARMALYVDGNRYPLIASMESVLASSPLQTDDEVKYALGYSLARLGGQERPLKYLAQIRSPHLIERSALLRKSILDSASH